MPKKKEIAETSGEGSAPGTVEPQAAVPAAREPAKSQKVPKLSKKNKSKLPRREKKALQKSSK